MREFFNKFNKRMTFIMLFVFGCIAMFIACYLVDSGCNIMESFGLTGPGCTVAVMAVVGSLKRVTDKETAGNQITCKVWLIALDQVNDTTPFPIPTSSGEIGSIPLLPGEYMHYFEAIDDSLEDKSSGAKGDITTAVTNTFSFIVGAHRQSLLQFLEDHAGDRFLIIYQMADSREYYLLGNDLKPMILKSFERSNGKDSRSTSLTFENTSFVQPKKYVGALVRIEPVTLAANATTIAFTAAVQYRTGENTAATTIGAFTGLSVSDEGRTVEIIGSGGSHPSKISEVDGIVLRAGATWTGNVGSKIIFKVLDSSTLVELSRIQTS